MADENSLIEGLASFLDQSPSPFHAVHQSRLLLQAAGFTLVDEREAFPTAPGRYVLVRGGSLVAWSTDHEPPPQAPFRMVGAHTDSPTLRVKPQPEVSSAGWDTLGVEVYGGPLLHTWLDRDLGLAGRVSLRQRNGQQDTRLIHVDEPVLRVSSLAIHLDRTVNSEGLQLNPQQHLAPHWSLTDAGGSTPSMHTYIADKLGVGVDEVQAWDLMVHDLTPARRIGRDYDLLASGRLDNLATCYAAIQALLRAVETVTPGDPVPAIVMFDHEEVGSMSERGAQSTLLPAVLERTVLARGGDRSAYLQSMAGTVIASGDMAHATHPHFAGRHEPQHTISMNGGPVLKVNANLRYATDSVGAGAFAAACAQADVPMQTFVTRTDLPCGSTVGPVTSALTGATTVDFGAPVLSMHSSREVCGVQDQRMYAAALGAFLAPA